MENERINKGVEHGVEWIVDSSKFDPVVITVKSLTTQEQETVVYNCQHRPIFGYDIDDNRAVEEILEKLIIKYANDGYGR